MGTVTYLSIILIGFIIAIMGEFILFKIWPKIYPQEISARHYTTVSVLIIDPLVASISCPLASDIFFSFDWLKTCDFHFVFFVLAALLTMSSCGLLLSFKIISFLIPSRQIFDANHSKHQFLTSKGFALSTLINMILTWITLSFTSQDVETFNPSEACFSFMVHEKVIFVSFVSYGFQLIFILFFSHLSYKINTCPNLKPVFECAFDKEDNKSGSSKSDMLHDLFPYFAMSLICLFLSHALRSAFLLCSCLPFIEMASGLYWTNFLILAKFPSLGLLYYLYLILG